MQQFLYSFINVHRSLQSIDCAQEIFLPHTIIGKSMKGYDVARRQRLLGMTAGMLYGKDRLQECALIEERKVLDIRATR